jgi:hypothetical protein
MKNRYMNSRYVTDPYVQIAAYADSNDRPREIAEGYINQVSSVRSIRKFNDELSMSWMDIYHTSEFVRRVNRQ